MLMRLCLAIVFTLQLVCGDDSIVDTYYKYEVKGHQIIFDINYKDPVTNQQFQDTVNVTYGISGPTQAVILLFSGCELIVDLEREPNIHKCENKFDYYLSSGDFEIKSFDGEITSIWCPNIYLKNFGYGLRPCFQYQCKNGGNCVTSMVKLTKNYLFKSFPNDQNTFWSNKLITKDRNGEAAVKVDELLLH